jgi:hypothetical protein
VSDRQEEELLIRAFLVPEKRERFVELLANPKRRAKATAALAHFRDLDPRWVVPLPSDQQQAESIERALRGRGAGDHCHAVSQSSAIDGKRLVLATALQEVVGYGMGTLLSCVPGELAFFEGEGPSDRCILARPRGM